MGGVSWIIQGPVSSQESLNIEEGGRGRESLEDSILLALKIDEKLQAKECRQSLETEKGKETDYLLDLL